MLYPVRVLQVVTMMNRGGLETMLMNYYRHIDRTKLQFDFLVHRDFEADYDAEIEKMGGKIYRLPRLNPFSKNYLNKLDDFFKEHREYRVVHSHLDCMAGIPLKYAKKNGVPVRVAHAHSSNQTKDKKYLLKLIYKKNISKYATNLFACAEMAGKWMFSGSDFEVLNNAIDAAAYIYNEDTAKKVRKSFGISDDTIVVGHIGRFSEPKNHDFLIDIFENIVKMNPSSVLMLVGIGDLMDKIKAKVNEKNLTDKVIFTGLRKDIPDILGAMDVFVFPSIYEGVPVTMIEAQAAGLPCIISDKVPIECKKTELVKQISLNESAEFWAKEAIHVSETERKDTFEEIKTAGFDIEENAKRLQEFYLKAYSGEKNLCLY